jgi:hypothetical protein
MSNIEPAVLPSAALSPPRACARWMRPQLPLLVLGIVAWAFGVSRLALPGAGSYGLLAGANPWFLIGLGLPLVSLVLELASERRAWLMGAQLLALLVAIHATVPLLFGVPEYAWVYKHIGIASAFQRYGHVTDPSNIYQQWPALFAAVAAIASLGHVGIDSLALWSPLVFELADAVLLFAIFRLLSEDRRVSYLAVALYVGLVSWVGQDYLSPQAFSYLLWLGMAYIILRWLRAPAIGDGRSGRIARLRAPLLAGMAAPPVTSPATRRVMVAVLVLIYFAIVAAHQLTPYIVLAGVGALTVLDLVRPRWLLLGLAVIAGAYLAPHYSLIAQNFGGLFNGGNPIQNASGSRGTYHAGPERLTALVVRMLAGVMWLSALWAVARKRGTLGRVAIPTALAFSPFVILGAQSYGGEAIYRVYLFSAPWCALLIATTLFDLRPRLRWPLAGAVGLAILFAGVQGLYGPVSVDAFTSNELSASHWVYGHIPRGSLIVLPDDNFPALESADYNDYNVQVMPADPQNGESWMNEGNLGQVKRWIVGLGHRTAYIVVSRSMSASAAYFGAPRGYNELVSEIPNALRGSVVYHNTDASVYRLDLTSTPLTEITAPQNAVAATPATIPAPRASRPLASSRTKASASVRSKASSRTKASASMRSGHRRSSPK